MVDRTRGASGNIRHRFETFETTLDDGGWDFPEWLSTEGTPLRTSVATVTPRSMISRNQSPDVPFEQSVNPYQGCEHGCIYCFARPSHAYHDLNPGLDFESRIIAKPRAATVLRRELAKPGYQVRPLAIAPNTDAWQPVEANLKITRSLLELMVETRHPCVLITKSRLALRDLDLLQELAAQNLLRMMVSLTSLDSSLKRSLEPRAAGPQARLQLIRKLHEAGVAVGCLLAPIIPAINDAEIESLLTAGHEAGAVRAGWILLRLPHEVAPLFESWLQQHFPARAAHVMSLVRQARGGKAYDADFRQRQRGTGPYVQLLDQRFRVACRKLGLNADSYTSTDLRTDLFTPPPADERQRALF